MPEPGYALAALAVAGLVTLGLRMLPFAVLGRARDAALVRTLESYLPAGLMVILAVYALSHLPGSGGQVGVPAAIALVVTVGLHLWRRHAVLSVLGGTIVYVGLVNVVFG
jgi:branched-subunit amino acid transport protein AzlD